jgi:hypothetical protein
LFDGQHSTTALLQLEIIREVTERLAAADIACWLYGGWGVDFLVGRVTRDHEDIDMVVGLADASRVADVLAASGYTLVEQRPESLILRKQTQLAELLLVTTNAAGQTIIAGGAIDWVWPEGSFDGPPGRIGGVSSPAISRATLLRMKEAYAQQDGRPRDREDLDTLRGIPLPGRGNAGADEGRSDPGG